MKSTRSILWFCAFLLILAGSGCVSKGEATLPEDTLTSESTEEEEEEDFCDDDDEFCEEEEEGEEVAWNGIDQEILGEDDDLENEEQNELIEQTLMETEVPVSYEPEMQPLFENNFETAQTLDEPIVNTSPQALIIEQADLTLSCEPTGTQAGLVGMTRYGCKAFLKTGSYYGVIKGWWQVRRSDGVRIRIKHLTFRDGSYDATFYVPDQDAFAGVQAAPSVFP